MSIIRYVNDGMHMTDFEFGWESAQGIRKYLRSREAKRPINGKDSSQRPPVSEDDEAHADIELFHIT